MEKTKVFKVKNRSAGVVGYNLPELGGLRREFMPGEEKTVSFEELEKLSFQPGGRILMESFLQITDEDVTGKLNLSVEPEYYMSEEQIVELITNGSLDAFLDALDYAPTGVMDLLKQFSVSLPMTDTQKIRALKEKTGFDVAAALKNIEAEKEEDEVFTEVPKKGAAAAKSSSAPSGRRTSTTYKTAENKYKVVNSEDK